jgi:CBS domain-containing protein
MRAKDVMSKGVMSVTADATVLEAIKLLVNTRVSAMPVLDGQGVMIGIVSEADLLPFAGLAHEFHDEAAARAASDALNARRVSDVMTRDVATVDEDTPLLEIVDAMSRRGVKRLPVRSGKLIVGIVSRVDLLRALASRWASAATMGGGMTEGGAAHLGDNDQLRHAVQAATEGKDWSLAEGYDVIAMGGSIHLWGVVPTLEVDERYRTAAQAVPGVRSVISHMTIKSR